MLLQRLTTHPPCYKPMRAMCSDMQVSEGSKQTRVTEDASTAELPRVRNTKVSGSRHSQR